MRALFLLLSFASLGSLPAATPEALFHAGADAYHAGDYRAAVAAYHQAVAMQPSSGSLQNLGNAEWQCGSVGPAILAWEQVLWLDPFNSAAHQNLRFARKAAQLESPELTWYEVVSTWLPVNWWAWIAGASLWLAVGMALLPGILRMPKRTWHQAVAACGLMIFLLSVPALAGVQTRSRLGFVLTKETPLRLTPTEEAQTVTRLSAGEPARWLRSRGKYVLVRTNRATGWVEKAQFGLTCPGSNQS